MIGLEGLIDIIFGNYKSFNNYYHAFKHPSYYNLHLIKMRILRRGASASSFTLQLLVIIILVLCVTSLKLSKIQQNKTHPTPDEEEDIV